MLKDAASLPDTIQAISKSYTKEELRLLRSGTHFTDSMVRKLIESVLEIARTSFAGHPAVQRLPSVKELPNTFIFRVALCGYLLVLDWISEGGANGAKPSTLRNDMIDVNFAAYATFFDGLLSRDGKAQRIYQQASLLLRVVFVPSPQR